jgi:hypothetical protein
MVDAQADPAKPPDPLDTSPSEPLPFCTLTRACVPAGDGKSLHDPAMKTPQAQALELMCRCDEVPDEGVELQILKGILTATTSGTFTIHGQVGGWPGHRYAQEKRKEQRAPLSSTYA